MKQANYKTDFPFIAQLKQAAIDFIFGLAFTMCVIMAYGAIV